MPQTLDIKVGEWRDADRKARELEKAIADLSFLQSEATRTAELVREARMLRKLANEKLKAAIAAIRPKT